MSKDTVSAILFVGGNIISIKKTVIRLVKNHLLMETVIIVNYLTSIRQWLITPDYFVNKMNTKASDSPPQVNNFIRVTGQFVCMLLTVDDT